MGYRTIATALNLIRDQERCYCRKLGLDGRLQGKITEKKESLTPQGDDALTCKTSGAFLEQPLTGRQRKFCCDECRRKWDNYHAVAKVYEHKCAYCGKPFKSRASKQNYCSRNCYKRDRFWREEDTEKIAQCLREEKRPKMVSVWVKKLLIDDEE